MNGEAFNNLPKLSTVFLLSNTCINRIFTKVDKDLKSLTKAVSERCGYLDEADVITL